MVISLRDAPISRKIIGKADLSAIFVIIVNRPINLPCGIITKQLEHDDNPIRLIPINRPIIRNIRPSNNRQC